ncbi:MAG: alpha-xylosidase, partial [Clostridia bacterium]|nr:alpha-xylosidase [Clostridia bacterium]
MNEKYRYKTTPIAADGAIIKGDKYRFTILTSQLLRIEYSNNGCFEDGATQLAINRQFDVPEFSLSESNNLLTITTEHIELTYDINKPFLPTSLKLRYIGKNSCVEAGIKSTVWSFGSNGGSSLFGTARTLDGVDGPCELESGIMSRGAVTVLDDSDSLIICENGNIEPRKNKEIDQYLFCYGDCKKKFDYKACLKDFYKLSGSTPLLPRFALGNWWSRYHAYTQDEYINLMKQFKKEDIPFSVSVIDMDWHYVDIDSKYGTGWTGYTWNDKLFPNHKEFLEFLHAEGLEPSLNLHPQEGVAAHEAAYKAMAKAMGIDPESETSVPFEIENPDFIENYFKYLHHPLEDEGIRFWWLDW